MHGFGALNILFDSAGGTVRFTPAVYMSEQPHSDVPRPAAPELHIQGYVRASTTANIMDSYS